MYVDRDTAWLFVVGKDVFDENITDRSTSVSSRWILSGDVWCPVYRLWALRDKPRHQSSKRTSMILVIFYVGNRNSVLSPLFSFTCMSIYSKYGAKGVINAAFHLTRLGGQHAKPQGTSSHGGSKQVLYLHVGLDRERR